MLVYAGCELRGSFAGAWSSLAYIYIILYNYHQLVMFDDFFYHTPVQEPTWTGLPEPRRYQWAAFRFGIRDTQKFRWSKWNAKDFFPLDDLDGDFFSRFFC